MAASQSLQAVQDLAGKRKESRPFLLIVPMLLFFQAISVQSQIWFLESHFSNQILPIHRRALHLSLRFEFARVLVVREGFHIQSCTYFGNVTPMIAIGGNHLW